MRNDIYDMFSVYKPEFQYRWNAIISAGFERFAAELAGLAIENGLRQSVSNPYVLWETIEGNPEVMFAYLIDPRNLDGIMACYSKIKKESIPLTFVFIEQREDGAKLYDIFRFSERSYLEHTNRAYVKGTSCD